MLDINDQEIRRVAQVHITQVKEPTDAIGQLMIHFSSWMKLKRAVAWFLKLKHLLKELTDKKRKLGGGETRANLLRKLLKGVRLTLDDLVAAEKEIVKFYQSQSFKELAALQKQGKVGKSCPIYKLSPILEEGVMKVAGRAAMPDETKQHVILPKNSHLATLLLRFIHHSTAHAGRNHMLAQLRQKFWIPGASGAIRRILHQCVTCKKLHGRTGQQLMAELPPCRVLPDDPPFTRVGVDYFGPFLVKRGRV